MFIGGKAAAVFSAMVVAAAVCASPATARVVRHHAMSPVHHGYYHRHVRVASAAHVIQCVAFAKWDTGMDLSGNARDWWGRAAGTYERGNRPESGSVLAFRANERMPLGHVAVVSGTVDSRTIVIDQSHWNSRGIARDVEVKDVSENNDWTAVRVQLGHGGGFGSIYPTHGFIYPRADRGELVANVTHAAMPSLDPAPADLRGRRHEAETEVAEAPARPIDLSIPFDGPNRGLR